MSIDKYPPEDVRDDFVPKEAYFAQDFADLEAEKLWPFVWQLACRAEEVPNVGDYLTYNIVDDSIVVVRSGPTEIRAFHNVCPHRARRLTTGCGNNRQFVCPFHGWRFGLDGQNIKVIDKGDWGDCLKNEDIQLSEVQCQQWGGFVFINMDENAEPLIEFLAPMPDYCEKFEFEKLRFEWYKTVIMPSNWKTVLGFFNEFYHVQQAHPQLLEFTDDYSNSGEFGRHSQTWFTSEGAVPFRRSPRLPPRPEPPMKDHIVNFAEQYKNDLGTMLTPRNYAAAMRVRDEVPAGADASETLTKWVEFHLEAAAADGSGWPEDLTPEYIEKSGLDWHVSQHDLPARFCRWRPLVSFAAKRTGSRELHLRYLVAGPFWTGTRAAVGARILQGLARWGMGHDLPAGFREYSRGPEGIQIERIQGRANQPRPGTIDLQFSSGAAAIPSRSV
jgi:phenylpropionate dioxygenase-like ring-hydroxylating dioxygenase large terminal subunit